MASDPKSHERRQAEVVPDDPEQSARFIEAARELRVGEPGEAYERALDRILPPRKAGEPAPKRAPGPKPSGRKRRTEGSE